MRENYLRKSVDALDVKFLLIWLVGDLMAFFGSVFTNQVPLVRVCGCLFALNDAVLLLQWFYFKKIYRPPTHYTSSDTPLLRSESDGGGVNVGGGGSRKPMLNSNIASSIVMITCFMATAVHALDLEDSGAPLCNNPPKISETVKTLGIVMSWISNSSYVVARFPQIIKNARRRSVEGLR